MLQSVEKHRSKLKELRTRHQYLTGWLIDHVPELDEASKALERTQAYANAITRYAETIRKKVQQDISEPHLLSGPPPSLQITEEGCETSLNTEPLRFTELELDFEDELRSQETRTTTTTARQPNPKGSTQPENQTAIDETLQSPAQATPHPSAVNIFVLVILSATILGVLFAWSLVSTHTETEPPHDPVMLQKESK